MLKGIKLAWLHLPSLSFQEPLEEEDEDEKGPNPPMMVPVADILNHVANHNANLEYSPVSAQPLCQARPAPVPLRGRAGGSSATARPALHPRQLCSPATHPGLHLLQLKLFCSAYYSAVGLALARKSLGHLSL